MPRHLRTRFRPQAGSWARVGSPLINKSYLFTVTNQQFITFEQNDKCQIQSGTEQYLKVEGTRAVDWNKHSKSSDQRPFHWARSLK